MDNLTCHTSFPRGPRSTMQAGRSADLAPDQRRSKGGDRVVRRAVRGRSAELCSCPWNLFHVQRL